MKKETIDENRPCPKCGKAENQIKAGYNRSGIQRCVYKDCKHKYTLNGKIQEYPEEVRNNAIRIYYSGASGRGMGKLLGMNKANVYNWIKKRNAVWIDEHTCHSIYELDELYIGLPDAKGRERWGRICI